MAFRSKQSMKQIAESMRRYGQWIDAPKSNYYLLKKTEANSVLKGNSQRTAAVEISFYSAGSPRCAPTRDDSHKSRFFNLANQWRRETAHMSVMSSIIAHPAYQQIIEMGANALPFIFSELKREPDHWFVALRAITGENPVQPNDRGRLGKMTDAWLGWGRQRGFQC